jgi:hypothetical protein
MRMLCRLFAVFTVISLAGDAVALTNYFHVQGIVNDTGTAANDLHVNVVHPPTGVPPIAPPFTGETTTGNTMNFTGGNVPANSGAVATWQSKFASDTIDPATPGNWTFNGANIGAITVAKLSADVIDAGGGKVTVELINNSGSALSYSNLSFYTGANGSLFHADTVLSGLTTGTSLTPLIATSGLLQTGTTDIVTFTPSTAGLYDGGSLQLSTGVFGGAAMVPEPSSYVLAMIGMVVFGAYTWRQRRVGRVA